VERLYEHAPGLVRGVRHALRFVGVRGQRLLAQHVLAGAKGSDRPLAVEGVGERVVDGVDLRVRQQGVVALVDAGDPVLARELASSLGVAGCDGHDLDLRHPARRA
jgi:hypothetical protein